MKNQKSKNRFFYVITLFVFLAGVSGLLYSGFMSSSVYFLNVSEALAQHYDAPKKMRLFGTVENFSTLKNNSLDIEFSLLDNTHPDKIITVRYSGIIPDSFKKGAEVIAEGEILPNHNFQAKTIMTKCPSKYQKENRT